MVSRRACAGGVAACLGLAAQAAVAAGYTNDFNNPADALTGTASGLSFLGWTLTSATLGAVPVRGLPAGASGDAQSFVGSGFLGELGGDDVVSLTLGNLPAGPLTVSISFDAYLLRSWDGESVTFGPDTFGFGYNGTTLLSATFSNGAATQSYCPYGGSSCAPTFSSDAVLKDSLGFDFGLWTPGDPNEGRGSIPMSLVYHFPDPVNGSAPGYQFSPFVYTGDQITFSFFGDGLQLRTDAVPAGYDLQGTPLAYADESWGIDNLRVTVTPVPEPSTLVLSFLGLAALIGWRRLRA